MYSENVLLCKEGEITRMGEKSLRVMLNDPLHWKVPLKGANKQRV
jgi:hypothetical protein